MFDCTVKPTATHQPGLNILGVGPSVFGLRVIQLGKTRTDAGIVAPPPYPFYVKDNCFADPAGGFARSGPSGGAAYRSVFFDAGVVPADVQAVADTGQKVLLRVKSYDVRGPYLVITGVHALTPMAQAVAPDVRAEAGARLIAPTGSPKLEIATPRQGKHDLSTR